MDTREEKVYYFEDVEVDILRGYLKCSGEEKHLRPKTFQVLVYLIEHRGTNIPKNDLINAVWKNTAVVDDVLVQSVKDIRRALGDNTQHPRFIRTIPKFGYRFISEISERQLQSLSNNITNEPAILPEIKEIDEAIEDKSKKTLSNFYSSQSGIRSRFVLISILFFVAASLVLGFVGENAWPGKRQTEAFSLSGTKDKKSLMVMFFENQSNNSQLDWLREGLTDMLITELSRSAKLKVLSRGQLHLLLERTKNDPAEKIGLDETIELARRAGAETIITGSFAQLGEKVRVEVQIYNTNDKQLQAAESLTVDRPEQILTEIDLLSLKLANRLVTSEPNAIKSSGLSESMTNNLEAYRYYSLGVEQAQALHSKQAIELLEKAVEIDPQFAMAHARIGYAYAVTWDLSDTAKPYLEKAFQLSDRLTEKDRLNIAAWYSIANRDYQTAIEQFRQIIAKYPLEIEAYHRLSRLLRGEDRPEEAIQVLKQGLAIDPEAKNLYNSLGGILSSLGRHEEAIAAHQRYVALAINEPNAYDSLGLTYQWSGDYESAIVNYNRALELNPDFDVAIVHIANVRFQLGQYREAIELFKRYIKIAPSDTERSRGYQSIALIYFRKQNSAAAESAANEALKIRKDATWIPYLLAKKQGDTARANELKELLFTVARFSNRGGKGSRREIFYYHGAIALETGAGEEAIKNFQEALRQSPPTWNIDTYEDCLADSYLRLNRPDEAIVEYERILKLNPNYPLIYFYLAQAYEKKGQNEQAKSSYEKFLEVWKDADADIPEVISAKKSLGSL